VTARRPAGFTLVEVMIALFVVALALPALLFALSQQVDATAYLRDKSVAHAVASNKLSELRILSQARQAALRSSDSGVTHMAQRDWYWWVDTQPTQNAYFYRVDIVVAAREDARDTPLYTLVASLPLEPSTDSGGVSGK